MIYPTLRTTAMSNSTTATTSFTITIPASVTTGDCLYVVALSRGHTSTTAKFTCTDNDTGGNTWTEKAISSDRKTMLFYKRATSATASKTITINNCVNSCTGGLTVFYNTTSGDPTVDIGIQENASGTTTHTGITPSNDNSMVCFSVTNDTNDLDVTSIAAATLGTFSVAWEQESTGGSDCKAIFAYKLQTGTKTGTGNITWTQSAGTTDSLIFTIKPNQSPTVVLDLPDDLSQTTNTTPDLKFTGTDTEANAVEYNIQVDTVNTFNSSTTSDSVLGSYFNHIGMYQKLDGINGSLVDARSESFVTGSKSYKLKYCKFYMIPNGSSLSGNVVAKLYTYNGIQPTTLLATSDTRTASSITSGLNTFNFTSSNQVTLDSSSYYSISIEYNSGDASNYFDISVDYNGTYSGDQIYHYADDGSWNYSTGYDVNFYVYGDTIDSYINKKSETDSGFTSGHPFSSGTQIVYTPSALPIDTYYWRVRSIDPSGSNVYGAWTSYRTFEVISATNIKSVLGVSYSSIGKILGVSKASIKKIVEVQ